MTSRRTTGWLLILTVILFPGCEMFEETEIDPFEGQETYFTMYGFLDAAATEQAIRVIPVRRTPEIIRSPTETNAFIDATVTSTDLETGATLTWRHELAELADGTFAHIFRTSLVPRAGRSYRIDAVRSDGANSTATVAIPHLSSVLQPLPEAHRVDGEGYAQDVVLPGVTFAAHIDVFYDISDGGQSLMRVTRSYGGVGSQTDDGGWRFTLDLSADAAAVHSAARPVLGFQPFLNGMGVRVRWADNTWPLQDGDVDIDVLAQPGALTNVERGFGFIGAIGDYLRFWDVDDEQMKSDLGFL